MQTLLERRKQCCHHFQQATVLKLLFVSVKVNIMSEIKSLEEGFLKLATAGAIFAGEVADYDVVVTEPAPDTSARYDCHVKIQ